jgi:hypothetical protein
MGAAAAGLLAMPAVADCEQPGFALAGTWVMDAAYEILADGRRVTNYGEHPDGLLMIDIQGRYSLQIFRPLRARFASGDKTRGSADEYREAVLGSSTHTGRIEIDTTASQLVFHIDTASYPNWEGTRQVRDYTLADGLLKYAVPASASGNGTVAHSWWRRAAD